LIVRLELSVHLLTGYAYYGEYPLAFAACFGNKDIYDLLIQYGANPNKQDMFGNTILHMCVINYNTVNAAWVGSQLLVVHLQIRGTALASAG
jgi:hypothetical protein